MPHINVDPDYPNHPKTKRLVEELGPGASCLPIHLWCHAAKYHWRDGRLRNYGAAQLELAIGWWGEPGQAVAALTKSGFLGECKTGWKIHDWREYQGHIEHFKILAREGAKARWKTNPARRKSLDPQQLNMDATGICHTTALHSNTPDPVGGSQEGGGNGASNGTTTAALLELVPAKPPFGRAEFELAAKTESISGNDRDECWDYYASQDWRKSNGRGLGCDPRAVLRNWMHKKEEHGKRQSTDKTGGISPYGGVNRNIGTYNDGDGSKYRALLDRQSAELLQSCAERDARSSAAKSQGNGVAIPS